jgi:hypothetical protein
MTAISLPPPTQPLTNKEFVTEPWYRVLTEIGRLRTELDDLRRLTAGMGAVDVAATGIAIFVGST